jgi:2-polyprenyl-6-hydroxyphenyl methylase/3-demethylubiquinone-9 3-methyltransferase
MAYYAEKLAGERLKRCYEIAPPRVKQYLRAEIDHVLDRLHAGDAVLELGCGYGRVAFELAKKAARVVGIDTAAESLDLGRQLAAPGTPCEFIEMDASAMRFPDKYFDAVICLQNGICAFGVEKSRLVREAARVCRAGGRILFSSYTEAFWPHRLAWFEQQAAQSLLGEIDREATGEGVIVCKDGFRAGFMGPAEFRALWSRLGLIPEIREVDGSATFCESRIK